MPATGNLNNLIQFNTLTEEERKKFGVIGGKASGLARKKKSTFKELAQMLLEMPAPQIAKEKVAELFPGMNDEEMTARLSLLFVQYAQALAGDNKSFELLRDTAGEKPVEKIKSDETHVHVNITDLAKRINERYRSSNGEALPQSRDILEGNTEGKSLLEASRDYALSEGQPENNSQVG